MTPPSPRVEVDIRGTQVGFLRRDIRQITDAERALVEDLVSAQQREAGADQTVTRIVIETDYPDPDRLAYTASYRVHVSGRNHDAGSSQPDGGGIQG